jgi:hypothetical protein
MKPLLASLVITTTLLGAAPASADPGSDCGFHDPRLCDLSKTYFCPDTGTYVPALAPCPSLVVGPYSPGGRTPNGGLAQ